MKRTALVAVLVAMFAMAPALTVGVGAQDVGTQAANSTIHFVNVTSLGAGVDIWDSVDGGASFTKIGVMAVATATTAGSVKLEVAAGAHIFRICANGGATQCASGTLGPDTSMNVAGASFYQLAMATGPTAQTVDLAKTNFGSGRFQVKTAAGPLASSYKLTLGGACVAAPAGTFEIPAQQNVPVYIGSTTCAGTAALLDIAAGTNLALLVGFANCTAQCVDSVGVGELKGTSTSNATQFCTSVIGLQGLSSEMKSVFGGTGKDNVTTLLDLARKIQNAVKAGDAVVPSPGPVADAWGRITDGLLSLAAGIEAAGGDFAAIPASGQKGILDFVNGTGAPDPQSDADTAVLTDYYTTNCIPSAGPSFTG